jgi:predicted nucleic acid-binding protein
MRVFWDTMLFVYLLERNPTYVVRVRALFEGHINRRDELCTSNLALGELMVGPRKLGDDRHAQAFRNTILSYNFRILPFDMVATNIYSQIRATTKVTTPDAIHLACAAAEGVDVFITNDTDLPKFVVSGVGKIVGLDTNIF